MLKRLLSLLIFTLPLSLLGAERDYQEKWCAEMGGKTEVSVEGGRVDCLTEIYAIEVDHAKKWKQAIAQARWYGLQTGKRPGILLIVGPGDQRYVDYIEEYKAGYDIYLRVWTIEK